MHYLLSEWVYWNQAKNDITQNHKGKKKQNKTSAIFSHDLSLILSFAIREQAVNYESHWEEKGK